MQHLDEGTIHSWLDGALSADEAARVEAHVKECPQCASAVAEARGFIAASSRILTALDNAPRGVIPVAAPIRRRNWAAWRAAAAVLVVAVGSFVVLRNRGDEHFALIETPEKNPVQQPAPPVVIRANPSRAGAATSPPQAPIDAIAPEGATLSSKSAVGNAVVALPGKAATRNSPSGAEKGKFQAPIVAPSPLPGAIAMDAAEPEQLRVVGTPRRVGSKVTLYEVAPGDTVTLTESVPVTLQSVVTVTGAGTLSPQVVRKSAAQLRARADTAAPAAVDAQQATAPSSSGAVSARAPSSALGMVSTINTISWNDTTSRATLTLSGRLSVARLQEIRIRIERERTAAAARKNP